MEQGDPEQPLPTIASARDRATAMSVHVFTAAGAAFALAALLEAQREHWTAMFGWLGAALIVDGIDGTLARRFDVARLQPDISGDVLDLVVDFVTYVFVPAFAITASGILLPLAAPLLGMAIVVSSALYFADRRMKHPDNHFRGFPALWNVAAFYLFLLRPPALAASLLIAALVALTFVPLRVIHPVRVKLWRNANLALMAIWACLAIAVLINDFHVGAAITVVLSLIGIYILFGATALRLAGIAR